MLKDKRTMMMMRMMMANICVCVRVFQEVTASKPAICRQINPGCA